MRAKDLEARFDKKVRTRVLASMLTCKICNKLIKESTAIADCLHSFCQKCIYKRVFEEKSQNCPVCNVEINGSLLRPDATMRSLKVSLLGVHRRTPEQRAESKRIKFENVQASDDQAKKSTQSTKEGMISQDKGKKKVIYEPLVKLLEDKPYDLWDSFQAISGPKKGIVIRSSPPRSPPPPPPVHKSETVLGSKSKEPKRRVRQKRVAIPSNGTMISPQDVIDAGKNIYPAKKTHYAWFILAPSEEQNRKEPLRPLMEPNVEIKFDWNSHPTVSTLMKYIAMKLTLDSGEKVGIYMFGGLLSPEMKLVDVKNEWMAIVGSERETTSIGTSALHFCIQLTYA